MSDVDLDRTIVPATHGLEIALRTLVVYFEVVLGLRVFGKRDLMMTRDAGLYIPKETNHRTRKTNPHGKEHKKR